MNALSNAPKRDLLKHLELTVGEVFGPPHLAAVAAMVGHHCEIHGTLNLLIRSQSLSVVDDAVAPLSQLGKTARIHRLAIVVPIQQARAMAIALAPLQANVVQVFVDDEIEQARRWLGEVTPVSLPLRLPSVLGLDHPAAFGATAFDGPRWPRTLATQRNRGGDGEPNRTHDSSRRHRPKRARC